MGTPSAVRSPQRVIDRRIRSSSPNDLVGSMRRTVVSSGNDALNLLFQAAAQYRAPYSQNPESSRHSTVGPHRAGSAEPTQPSFGSSPDVRASHQAAPFPEILQVWQQSWVVTTGCMTAEEALTFVDL